MKPELAKQLFLLHYRCRTCGQPFKAGRVNILPKFKGRWVFRALCGRCNISRIIAVWFNKDQIKGLTGDLTAREWGEERFSQVTCDDCLEVGLATPEELEQELIGRGILRRFPGQYLEGSLK